MSTPANFNGSRPVIDVNDTAMLLIDHQSGLFQTVGDMPMPELRARAAALAKMASLAGIPVITTASVPQGPNGPLIPEIHANAPHAQYIARKGEINAWDNPEFVAAVKATGRKTLIIAGTITSVCMAFPSIAAVADGYKVLPSLMLPVPIARWRRKSPSPASSRLASYRWIPQRLLLNCSAPGIARMPLSGPRCIPRSSRHTSC
ncbi:putative cysteine hydrolase [Klebsiella michiganensis]|nr:putative cysteine hydrolase [Klebsiella michiganensis]